MNGAKLTKDSLFEKSRQLGLKYVLDYNPDRLLSPCYTALGKTAPAPSYGGWESMEIQGHSLGHYLSALSAFIDSTNSDEAKKNLDYTVSIIKSLQRKDGYFGGIPSEPFEKVFYGKGNFKVERFNLGDWWVPWYSVHKIFAGLIDAYRLAANEDALAIVKAMCDWTIKGTSAMTEDEFQKMLTCEHGGMCKVFADMYEITGEKKYLDEAERFIHKEIFIPLSEEKDQLQGYHANTQIPKIIGLAKLYDLTKKEEYKRAAEFFFKTVTEKRSYANGGNSVSEHFGREYDERLARDTTETCNTYNMLELACYIFKWNPSSKVADFYERALYNHILASQDPASGAKTYFVSMLSGFFKVYCSKENSFWCCTGTGMENPARYNRFIYEEINDSLYINLFIPSCWEKDGWKIKIETDFPYGQQAVIKILSRGEKALSLKVRSPWWNKNPDSDSQGYVKINPDQNEYIVDLSMKLSLRDTKDGSTNFSIFYGPLLLAADWGNKNLPQDITDSQLVYMNTRAMETPYISVKKEVLLKDIKSTDSSNLIFTLPGKDSSDKKDIRLIPFFNLHHRWYSVYFNNGMTPGDKRLKELEEISLDYIECGRQQSEIEHGFESEDTESGYIGEADKSFRKCRGPLSHFSYKIKAGKKIIITVFEKDSLSAIVKCNGQLLTEINHPRVNESRLKDIYLEVKQNAGSDKELKIEICGTEENLKILEIRSAD
ncbi:beta-L-arabinofuranosidase domain-containing protein [Treponema sp.]|uniref:beta-L-arabinofuranosidase domain-containing protein n=1 Tax=Treponema sp. TaxID=166 RepID=UPI0025F13031|nr:beta-L-arabinofuranosidase domain-containing protein [Treponema sp.]MCR5217123.1 glycoside hydrolase family 127 protein [Treponema sp.]